MAEGGMSIASVLSSEKEQTQYGQFFPSASPQCAADDATAWPVATNSERHSGCMVVHVRLRLATHASLPDQQLARRHRNRDHGPGRVGYSEGALVQYSVHHLASGLHDHVSAYRSSHDLE